MSSVGILKDRNSNRLGMTYRLGLRGHCKDWQFSHNAIGHIPHVSMSFSCQPCDLPRNRCPVRPAHITLGMIVESTLPARLLLLRLSLSSARCPIIADCGWVESASGSAPPRIVAGWLKWPGRNKIVIYAIRLVGLPDQIPWTFGPPFRDLLAGRSWSVSIY